MIVPSPENDTLDQYLSSSTFLSELVHEEEWGESGIMLQPEGIGAGPRVLLDVFPAFQTAFNEITWWPGMLFWTPRGDSIFLSFPGKSRLAVREGAGWAVSNLRLSHGGDLKSFEKEYVKRFPAARRSTKAITTLIHLSDTHIGSVEASKNIPRLQQLLRNSIAQVPPGQKIISVFTGDIIDSPNETYYDSARQFVDVLRNLTKEDDPIFVLGNHDVRKDGYLSENLRVALRMSTDKVRWIDDRRLGLVCFNSVLGGKLAKGRIGGAQFADAGNDIDRKGRWQEYTLIGVLHHHPIPVKQPDWYYKPFYERIFGSFFGKTDELEDAQTFRDFAIERKFVAIMHGHKHVPRIDEIVEAAPRRKVAVIGCGSSVSKVPTKNNKIFLSINRVDINQETRRMSCRIMVERTIGAGMRDWEAHEIVYSRSIQ